MNRYFYLERELSGREVLIFFTVACYAFIYPLLLADYFYIDDSWRAQLAGLAWKEQGRILTQWLYQGLSFTEGAPNIFPLPLLASTLVMAFALRRLVFHYFPAVTLAHCFIVLPLWYSPFFLQNLSYQYDGPAMALGVAAVIYAMVISGRTLLGRIIFPSGLLAVALSFYQMNINVFVGLCCVELIRCINEHLRMSRVWLLMGRRLAQLGAGVLIYYLTAHQLTNADRTALLALDSNWFVRMGENLSLTAYRVGMLYNAGNAWLCWALLLLVAVGGGLMGVRIVRSANSGAHKLLLMAASGVAVVVLLVSVSGLAMVFEEFNDGARLMLGLGALLVGIFYLAWQALVRIYAPLGFLLVVPVVAMLSFSYAYGRVLNVQKIFTDSVSQGLAERLLSDTKLQQVQMFYMVNISTRGWLAGAQGSIQVIPALKYVLNVNFIVLPEMMPRLGETNVLTISEKTFREKVPEHSLKPVVSHRFYDIYVVGAEGYIYMKPLLHSEHYNMKLGQ